MAKYDSVSYKRPVNTAATLKRLFSYLGHSKVQLIAVSIAAALNGMIDVAGTYSYKWIINNFIVAKDLEGLTRGILILAGSYVFAIIADVFYSQTMVKVAQKTVYEIRCDLFKRMEQLPLSFFDKNSSGDLMSRFTNDIDAIAEALTGSYTLVIQSFTTLFMTVAALIIISPKLSVIVLICQLITSLYMRYGTKKSRIYFSKQQNFLGALNGFLEEMISGQKVIKVFNHESYDYESFCEHNEKLREAATQGAIYTGQMIPMVVSISYLNYTLAAIGGGLDVINGLMDIGSLTAFLICVRQTALPINQFTQQSNFILSALSGAERIFGLMDETPEIDEGSYTLIRNENGIDVWHDTAPVNSRPDVPQLGDIRFSDITFGYLPGKTILHDISLFAKPDTKIAFVGSTGAGKTTIINLVNRFYEIDQGTILCDGIDIRDIRKKDLRQSIAIIVQTTHLFSDTIMENIRYGKTDATDEEVIEAARLAHADSFIRRLPDGYQTMLRNDGDNLSQGQRQLLAIARAAVARPPILVLDEATSSIDTRTEKLIEDGLDSLMEGRTVLVIAHRLSTVRNSDCIMFLEAGQIIERGSHEELIQAHGKYAKLYLGQFELE